MKVLLFSLLLIPATLILYFIKRMYVGHRIGKSIINLELQFERIYHESGDKKLTVLTIFRFFPHYPLNKLSESERMQAVDIIKEAPDPMYMLRYMFITLTGKNLLKALKNKELLKEVVQVLKKEHKD